MYSHWRKALGSRRFLSLSDQALISIGNMCTTIIIGRTCSKQQLGLYASGYSLVLLATAIQTALISVPYMISLPSLNADKKGLYKGGTLLQQILLSVLGVVLFSCFGLRSTRSSNNHEFGSILLILASISTFICFRDFSRKAAYAELRYGFALVLDGLAMLLQVSGIVILALVKQLTASRALIVVGLATGVAGGIWLFTNWASFQFSLRHSLRDFGRNWAFGRWLLASSVLWSLCIEQYPWVLSTLRVPSEAAIWASCYGVMAFLNPLVLALNNDAGPRVSNDFATGGISALKASVRRSALMGLFTVTPVVLILACFGGKIVTLMYGDKYVGNGVIVTLLTLGFTCYATSLPLPYGILTLKRPRVDFTINVACFLSFLAFGVPLLKRYGVTGAAISFLIIQFVALICRVLGFQYALNSAPQSRTPSKASLGKVFSA